MRDYTKIEAGYGLECGLTTTDHRTTDHRSTDHGTTNHGPRDNSNCGTPRGYPNSECGVAERGRQASGGHARKLEDGRREARGGRGEGWNGCKVILRWLQGPWRR